MEKKFKLIVYVPASHAQILRNAMGEAGAGQIGNYSHCTFTISGVTRFRPEAGANPADGEVGK